MTGSLGKAGREVKQNKAERFGSFLGSDELKRKDAKDSQVDLVVACLFAETKSL
jgi:hypothetical protein